MSNNKESAKSKLTARGTIRFLVEADQPFILWSAPGVGKTAIIESIARARGWCLETVIASIRMPQDFLGYPIQVDSTLKFAPPDWAVRISQAIKEGKTAVLFIDELSTAPFSVQAALLRIVNERVCGDLSLSGMRVICAANPKQQANGYNLSLAMKNRFTHIDYAPELSAWGEWIESGGDDSSYPEDSEEFKRADAGMIKKYLSTAYNFLKNNPKFDNEVASGVTIPPETMAWCSRRSLHMASEILANAEANGIPLGESQRLILGTIGTSASVEFIGAVKKMFRITIHDVFTNLTIVQVATEQQMESLAEYISDALDLCIEGKPNESQYTRDSQGWAQLTVVSATIDMHKPKYSATIAPKMLAVANKRGFAIPKFVADKSPNEDGFTDVKPTAWNRR